MPPPAPHEGPPRGLVAGVSSRACGSEPALGLRQLDSKDTGDCPGAVFWTFPGNGLLGNYGGDWSVTPTCFIGNSKCSPS